MALLRPAGTAADCQEADYQAIVAFLETRAAARVAHVDQTLFEHLQGTYELLREWGNPADLCHAGLCHALYGTDGLPVALLDVRTERAVLKAVIGAEAESQVYLYASCDRSYLYPQLGTTARPSFRDRFTGAAFVPESQAFAAFMELTFANELDMFRHDPALVEEHQATWGVRFERSRPFVSDAAFGFFRGVFGGPERRPR
jgi:hypothetical protein